MKKRSENTAVNATAFPEQVSVAMAEIAENTQEALPALQRESTEPVGPLMHNDEVSAA